MNELKRLLENLEDKLAYTRKLISEYDETLDYASHCNLQGFAEGIEFAMEEIEEMLGSKGQEPRVKGQEKREGIGKDKNKGKGRNKAAGKSTSEDKAKSRSKSKGRS